MDSACDEASNRNNEYWKQTKPTKRHNSTSQNYTETWHCVVLYFMYLWQEYMFINRSVAKRLLIG